MAKGKSNADAVESVFEYAANGDNSNKMKFASTVVSMARAANITGVKAEAIIKTIKSRSGQGIGVLRKLLAGATTDEGLQVAGECLEQYYASGDHLILTMDRSFWAYTGTHWQRVTDPMVKHNVLEIVKALKPKDIYARTMNAAFSLLVASQAAPGDVLRFREEPPPVINCRNGELWVGDDGKIDRRPHRHDSYLTYCLGVDFEPGAKCPEFDLALRGIFDEDADTIRHFEEFMGYIIQPSRDIASWFLLWGRGNNGKTKLMETVQKLMSMDAVLAERIEAPSKDKFVMGSLVGKLMLLDDDVDAKTKLPDGFMKKLSERKLLSGQLKNKDVFEFISCALPVMLANNWPRCDDLSWGTRRRANVIPFLHEFVAGEDEDPKIFKRIWAKEMSGVLNRAIEGLQRLRERGRFQDPESCVKAKAEFLRQAHTLQAYIDEACERVLTKRTLLTDFYAGYTHWCEDAGIRYVEPRNKIKGHLENLGFQMTKAGGNKNAVLGIRPKDKVPF